MEHTTSQTIAEQAHARGAFSHLVTGSPTDKLSTMDAIAVALSFPDYFGRNLDALYDCLTDLSWLPSGEHVLIWGGVGGWGLDSSSLVAASACGAPCASALT